MLRVSGPVPSRVLIAACITATIAFASYSRTLLPGVDLGDTGGFQAAVLWPEISARQAYPLYYSLARPFVASVAPSNPARGLNLFSAMCAGIAVGALTAAVAIVSSSIAGGVVAGLLLAFSFTYWTQAIIAEVYSLHLALVGACLLALIVWQQKQTTLRLALFFAVFAVSFGNHLSMILLLAPFAIFLLASVERPSSLVQPRIVMLALGIAVLGALQYLPSLLAVWNSIGAPERWTQRLAAFWFDVTKSDWRDSMVLAIGARQLRERAAFFLFDARLQFGIAGILLALGGVVALSRTSRPWAALVLVAYAINTTFAATYNVGDPHVFFMPGHYFTAFTAGVAVAAILAAIPKQTMRAVVASCAVAYALWRGYDTWPATDRHRDRRAEQFITRLTFGLDERSTLLATDLNWQLENALLYETRYRLPQVAWTRLSDVMLHFPLLVQDNHAGGRDVVVTAGAIPRLDTAFGPLFPLVADPLLVTPPGLVTFASRVPAGAPYVLTILTPNRDDTMNDDAVDEAIATLTGGRVSHRSGATYEVIVGEAGAAPQLHRSEARPFRDQAALPFGKLDIRLEGWVPFETFRRAGFGHIMLGRDQVLIVERGVSLAVLDGREPLYSGGLYEQRGRFRIPASGVPDVALLH
jgi:hypothetical protein